MKRVAFARSDWPTLDRSGRPAAADRLRLFRAGRLAAGAAGLAALPALALFDSWVPAAALMLYGLLPAAVALDCRRTGALPRAAAMGLAAAGAVLAAGVLKGLPAGLAFALLTVQAIEAAVAAGRLKPIAVAAVVGFAAIIAAGIAAASSGTEPLTAGGLAAGAMLAINAAVLARGLLRGFGRRRRGIAVAGLAAQEIAAMASEAVIASDRTGVVLRASANAARVLGLPASALLGRGLVELTLVADRPQLLNAISACAHGGAARRLRLRLRGSPDAASPTYRMVEFAIAPGSSGVALAALKDVTVTVEAEQAQAALAAETKVAQEARAAFLSTVNHELRTPLNAIIGFSDILANPATTPQSPARLREYATLINGAGQDLLRIVTAMIDITRLDSGVYDFESEPADLSTAVAAAIEAFQQEPEGATTSIELRPAAEPVEAAVDARAFRSVLHHVLSNAAKFGGGRSIVVSIGIEDALATVTVRDHGPGVPAEKLALLGRQFARLDESLARERGGIGLGLALASGLMALHDGRIAIANAEGGGAAVTLSLPRYRRSQSADNIRALSPRRTDLLAEDAVPQPAKRRASA